MSTEKKAKKVKELFVKDLGRIQGGNGPQPPDASGPKCPEITTYACGEEDPKCSAC